jgi:SAM-dependent methyltransferase
MSDYHDRLYQRYVSSHCYYRDLSTEQEYARLVSFYGRNYRPLLPANKHAVILDVACGTGHFCYYLTQAGYTNVSGIDLSPEMVEVCHARGLPGVSQGDVFDYLATRPAAFDLITAHHFVEHLTKPRILDFLDAAMGVLRPGGTLALTTPNAASLFGARDAFVDFTHEVGFTPESMSQVLWATGYDNVRVLPVRPGVGSWRGVLRNLMWGLAQQFSHLALALEGRPLLQPVVTSASLIGVGQRPHAERQDGPLMPSTFTESMT